MNKQITLDLDTAEHISDLLSFLIEELKEDLLEAFYQKDETIEGIEILWDICGTLNVLNSEIEREV